MPCLANSLCIASPDEAAVAGPPAETFNAIDEVGDTLIDESGNKATDQ